MTDYERGVELASAIYKEVIREYVAENTKLRELVRDMCEWVYIDSGCDLQEQFADRMRELEVDA